MRAELYILDRKTLEIKSHSTCYHYEINRDYLLNEGSTFTPTTRVIANNGDFIMLKRKEELNLEQSMKLTKVLSNGIREIRPLYFGIVDQFDNNKVVGHDLYNLINFEFPATRSTGNDVGQHMLTLLNRYLINDVTKIANAIQVVVSQSCLNVGFSHQPNDSPTSTNLLDYFIDIFKKYNITWGVESIYYDDNNDLKILTHFRRQERTYQLKDNSYYLVNWDVFIANQDYGQENMLLIIDSATTDMELPVILSTYYVDMQGNITQSFNENIFTPTKTKIHILDTAEPNLPTYLEIARSELSRVEYSHEITVDLQVNNPLIPFDDMEIGLLATIVWQDKALTSILTGYSIDSGRGFITLKFGFIKSTLKKYI